MWVAEDIKDRATSQSKAQSESKEGPIPTSPLNGAGHWDSSLSVLL